MSQLDRWLRADGCRTKAAEFRLILSDVLARHFEGRTSEDIVFDTHLADEFVRRVAARIEGTVGWSLVLRMLFNHRKNGQLGHVHRDGGRRTLRLQDRLDRVAYRMPAEAFRLIIIDVFEREFPGWTSEELLFDRPARERFGGSVRQTLRSDCPDDLIFRTLSNLRKHCRLRPRADGVTQGGRD
jgi:hypothetical protein